MKTLSIGDIHGRDIWKSITHGSSYEFNQFMSNPNSGTYPFQQYDKIIFVGDYVDSFTIDNLTILSNLNDIILFKKMVPDKVVLLLGNHDIQYFVPNQTCSGYRGVMRNDLYSLFMDNISLFDMAFQHKNYLWTHAGVTEGWLNQLINILSSEMFRFKFYVDDTNPQTPSEWINLAWELREPTLFNVDTDSGGVSKWAGPLWVRPRILNNYAINGFNQIVGHTPQLSVKKTSVRKGNIFYIDCLEHGDENPLVLDI